MKEQITAIRKLIISNKVGESLTQLFELVGENEEFEYLSENIMDLKYDHAHLLENETANASKPAYRALVKDVLQILRTIKNKNKTTSTFQQSTTVGRNIKPITPSNTEESSIKIACLYPNPIDQQLNCDLNQMTKVFSNYKVHVDAFYLNIETIQNLEGYDYIFIWSQIFKGKIYIESEFLESKVISITDLEDNIACHFKGLVLIAEGALTLDHVTMPFVHIKSGKNQAIKNFLFRGFKKASIDQLNEKEFSVKNAQNFETLPLPKGIPSVNLLTVVLPNELDKKIVNTFVGRKEEQTKLVKKILELSYSGKALTVKGAGGMGKTTLASKIAIELAYRNFFEEGVRFVACEHITSYKLFEAKIASCFEMDNSSNFTEHIRKYKRFDKLLILDNFETLLNLASTDEVNNVKDLVALITDYASIIITSREIIGFEFEDVMSLDRMQTDDALALFLQNSNHKKIAEADVKILREDIIENLLNNNPLAIKIISSPKVLPSHKDMTSLKEELEKDFFAKTSEEIENVFGNDVDLNIERKHSVYHSINYSYQKLKTLEKLAFELLHLFPDGIEMSNFKQCFSKRETETRIRDRNISALENKSLIENTQGKVKLQSIIGRFAKYQFSQRQEEEKAKYYMDVYDFNAFVLQTGRKFFFTKKHSFALALCDKSINNLLYTLEYMTVLIKMNEKKPYRHYICNLINYVLSDGAVSKYISAIQKLEPHFEEVKNASLLLKICEIWLLYHQKRFDTTFNELKDTLPFEKLNELDVNDEIDYSILLSAIEIYGYEGYALECINLLNKKECFTFSVKFKLFYLGKYNILNHLHGFYYFELLFNQGKWIEDEIQAYIDGIYLKNHLEIMQASYTLSKSKPLAFQYIDKLVVTNPYTKGLKNLMFAFIETEKQNKIAYFKTGIEHLTHITYYHIEAIYYFAKFLKSISDHSYQDQFAKGFDLAKKYQYRYLIHQFNNLHNDTNKPYHQEDYPLQANFDFDGFVKKYKEAWADDRVEKKQPVRIKHTQSKKESLTNKPPQKPALYVEGPTDQKAIQSALTLFQPALMDKIEITCELDERPYHKNNASKGGGVNWVKKRINGWLGHGWKIKAAALFDSDEDGVAAYQELKLAKDAPQNKTSKNYVEIFRLPNAYRLTHLAHLKELGVIIPVALEEMFPKFCWEHAHSQGWLEKRKDIDEIVRKSKYYDAEHDGTKNFLSKNNLLDELYLQCITMKHKEKFMNYILGLSEEKKKEAFQAFKTVTQSLAKFYQ